MCETSYEVVLLKGRNILSTNRMSPISPLIFRQIFWRPTGRPYRAAYFVMSIRISPDFGADISPDFGADISPDFGADISPQI